MCAKNKVIMVEIINTKSVNIDVAMKKSNSAFLDVAMQIAINTINA